MKNNNIQRRISYTALGLSTGLILGGIVGGILLWRRRTIGYVAGFGLLFQGSMLFIGLIVLLLLQPLLTDAPFAVIDVIVISVMGLICFIPFGLFVRGVISNGK